MPSSSKKQHNFMAAIANSPAFAKKVGIPQSVGKDFSNADKGKTFKRGGDMATKGVNPFAKFEKSSKDTEKRGMKEGSAKEMAMDRKQMMGMKKGGMAEGGMSDTAEDKAMIKKAFKQHDMQEHKGGTGTSLKLANGGVDPRMAAMMAARRGAPGMRPPMMAGRPPMMAGRPPMAAPTAPGMKGGGFTREADGIATKGKTKGMMVKMATGGFVRAADGVAQRGKTKGTQIKMNKGGMSC